MRAPKNPPVTDLIFSMDRLDRYLPARDGWLIYTSNTPPSINRSYKTTRNGGFYKDKSATEWTSWIRLMAMRSIGWGFGPGARQWWGETRLMSALYWFVPSNCDVDNSVKIIHDSLQDVLYPNDRAIDATLMGKSEVQRRRGSQMNKSLCIIFAPLSEYGTVNAFFSAMTNVLAPTLFEEIPRNMDEILRAAQLAPEPETPSQTFSA